VQPSISRVKSVQWISVAAGCFVSLMIQIAIFLLCLPR